MTCENTVKPTRLKPRSTYILFEDIRDGVVPHWRGHDDQVDRVDGLRRLQHWVEQVSENTFRFNHYF